MSIYTFNKEEHYVLVAQSGGNDFVGTALSSEVSWDEVKRLAIEECETNKRYCRIWSTLTGRVFPLYFGTPVRQ